MSSEELTYRPTQELVCELTQYLIQSGAEHYIEDSYTLTLDTGLQCDAVVTVQYTSQPTPHELRLQAEQERDAARAKLAAIQGVMGERDASELAKDEQSKSEYWAAAESKAFSFEVPTEVWRAGYAAGIQRITAAMAAEVAVERGNGSYWKEQYQSLRDDYQRTIDDKAALRAELAEVKGRHK